MPDAPEFLTLAEAAALARVHPDTLRKSTCTRMQRKKNGRLVFPRAAVLQWMQYGDTPPRTLEVA